jgi:hypothetical protein
MEYQKLIYTSAALVFSNLSPEGALLAKTLSPKYC